MPHPPHPYAYPLALMVVAIWSGFILVSRLGGTTAMTAWDLFAIRTLTAAVLLAPIWCYRRRPALRDRRMLALTAIGGLAYGLLAFSGFKRSPATHAAILLPGLLPFAIALAARSLLGERFGAARWVGLGLIGAGVASLAGEVFSPGATSLTGDLLLVAASACWAVYTVLLRRWAVAPLDAALAVTLLSAVFYLPVYAVALPKNLGAVPWSAILLQAFYQGVLASIVQMLLYVRVIALLGPTRLGALMALVPGVAGLLAARLLGEPLTANTLAGLALVSAGAWLANHRFFSSERSPHCPTSTSGSPETAPRLRRKRS